MVNVQYCTAIDFMIMIIFLVISITLSSVLYHYDYRSFAISITLVSLVFLYHYC